MEYFFFYLLAAFIVVMCISIELFNRSSDIELEPVLRARTSDIFAAYAKSLGKKVEVVVDSSTYFFSSQHRARRLRSWRVIRDRHGDFYSLRATVWEIHAEHSMVRVQPSVLRRWLFWRPSIYEKVFGESRRIRDLAAFGPMGPGLTNKVKR